MSRSPQFDDQTSPQADTKCSGCKPPVGLWLQPTAFQACPRQFEYELVSNEPLVLWDKITQQNCTVLDCFSSRVFEDTTYYQLRCYTIIFWRRDDQVEEAHEEA